MCEDLLLLTDFPYPSEGCFNKAQVVTITVDFMRILESCNHRAECIKCMEES